MADQVFMFMTATGTMVALAVLLFVSKGLRARSSGSARKEYASPSSSHEDKKGYDKTDKKVKKYSSDGKPIYED